MIKDDDMLLEYFKRLIGNFFKIIPLYEENNSGLYKYIESLEGNLKELKDIIHLEHSYEFLTLLTTLSLVKKEICKEKPSKSKINSETFKGIGVIEMLIDKTKRGG